jgi:hypothetical protein
VLRALSPVGDVLNAGNPGREDVRIDCELLTEQVDPPRFFPMIGTARLHHCHFKCTVRYNETIEWTHPFPVRCSVPRVEVVYIDRDHLHLCQTERVHGGVAP